VNEKKEETLMSRIASILRLFFKKLIFCLRALALIVKHRQNPLAVLAKQLFCKIKPIGRVHVFLRNELTGQVKFAGWIPNLVVNTGRYHIADQMADQGEAAMSHIAIGTGTTAAAAGDTALETELDRNALTSTTQGSGANAHIVTYIGDWAAGDGTGAITEAGIFNNAAAGQMLCRSVFAVKNKGAGDALTLTWVLTISS